MIERTLYTVKYGEIYMYDQIYKKRQERGIGRKVNMLIKNENFTSLH